jgi:hypothetical protein
VVLIGSADRDLGAGLSMSMSMSSVSECGIDNLEQHVEDKLEMQRRWREAALSQALSGGEWASAIN